MSAPRNKLTARCVLVHVSLAFAAVYVLYLLAIHLVIATPLLGKLTNRNSDKLFVEYGSAWSLWPGRLHVRGLRIRFKDKNVEAYLAFDKVVGTFDLFSIFRKQLRVRDIDAIGTTVRLRPRMQPDEATEDALGGVADIPGFPTPPLKAEPGQAPSDKGSPLVVDLEDVRVEPLRELWIGPYRFAGDARVTGGFRLRSNHEFLLRPSTMTVRSGDLTLAKRMFGQNVHGTVDAQIAEVDLREVQSLAFFRKVDAHLALESDVEDLGFLQQWLQKAAHVRVSGGRGRAKTDVRVASGVLQDGSVVDVVSERVLVRREGEGSCWLDAKGRLSIDGQRARGAVTFSDVRLERRFAESYPFRAERVELMGSSRAIDLATPPLEDLALSLDLPRGVLTNVRALTGLFGDKTVPEGGVARIALHLDYSVPERLLRGAASVESSDLALAVDDAHITARAKIGASLSRLDVGSMKGTIPHLYVDVRDALVRAPGGGEPPPPWWGHLDVSDVAIDKHKRPVASGAFAFTARDARPALHVIDAKTHAIPEWAKGPLALEGLHLVGRLAVGPGVALEHVYGEGGPIELGGEVRKRPGKHTEGDLDLAWGPLSLKIDLGAKGSVTPGIGGGPRP